MSSSPQDRYLGAQSGVSRKTSQSLLDTDSTDYEGQHSDKDAQREQDLDAARLMSHARGSNSSSDAFYARQPGWFDGKSASGDIPGQSTRERPAPPISGSMAVAMKQFYQQKANGSNTSLDSQSNFIDHRNQSHSLSVNPNSPLAMRARETTPSAREIGGEMHPSLLSPLHPGIGTHEHTSVSPRQVPSHGELHTAESPDMHNSPHTSTPSHPDELEDDVCFPLPNPVDDVAVDIAVEPKFDLPEAQRPGYPYTFDLQALDTFADEERKKLGLDASVPDQTNSAHDARYGSAPFVGSMDQGENSLYSRRHRFSTSGNADGGNRYQRKLAMFEGGQSFGNTLARSPFATEPNTDGDGPEDGRPLLKGTSPKSYTGYASSTKRQETSMRSRAQTFPVPDASNTRGLQALKHAMADKPYRFTFYSNALSNTIHARYLCELPAPGQTYEELLRGVDTDADAKPQQKTHQGPVSSKQQVPPPPVPLPPGSLAPSSLEPSMASEPNTWWLDVLCPTDQEMKVLSRTFGIHPLTTEDILMEETREKIELFRNYYLVCFRSFDQDPYSPTYLEPLNMYIIVFREGTLSFHFRHTPHPHNVRRRIKQLKDYINVTSDWISYALIDDITDAFGPLIQSIEFEVDSIDELVLILKEAEQSDMLRRIGTCRKKVMGLLRLMGNKADVVKGLAKRCNEYWAIAPKSDIGLYLSDIQDHLITMTQNLNHYEMILSRSHSNYLAQISIEMTDANNQINDVLSKLTALGTVIVPMNVITGLWGMNVEVPGQQVENLHWFGGIVAVMVVIAVSGYITTVRYLDRR
ncbi:CorA metal ion transporter [Malassezia vespertilionis]|uniref:Mnr2p n=1 Tax=Malassezia vespertilionis TaxID=2020962 RepID=A0A2N1J852_9BASI|nr:CorA metal ion transporter [Malassezia vespertilionis]PKI82741.1 Mnr2p [Malassezia vespertilionis]WFD08560.1 CorA metal ion transporter [Malassezia vespertilionis]